VFYGSNPLQKRQPPRWAISNATVTPKGSRHRAPNCSHRFSGPAPDHPVAGPGAAASSPMSPPARSVTGPAGSGVLLAHRACPRRAGGRGLYTMTDAEARLVALAGYRAMGRPLSTSTGTRAFEVLRHNSAILREETGRAEAGRPGPPPPAGPARALETGDGRRAPRTGPNDPPSLMSSLGNGGSAGARPHRVPGPGCVNAWVQTRERKGCRFIPGHHGPRALR